MDVFLFLPIYKHVSFSNKNASMKNINNFVVFEKLFCNECRAENIFCKKQSASIFLILGQKSKNRDFVKKTLNFFSIFFTECRAKQNFSKKKCKKSVNILLILGQKSEHKIPSKIKVSIPIGENEKKYKNISLFLHFFFCKIRDLSGEKCTRTFGTPLSNNSFDGSNL